MFASTRAALILTAALAACTAQAPQPTGYWRDMTKSISSMAVVDMTRLVGTWDEVAGYPLTSPCAPGAWTFEARGNAVKGQGCFLPLQHSQRLTPAGPGRWAAQGQEYWLLWVDADYRTMVVGTPSGSFAAILNRGGPISPDRLEAARKVLAFNGYDISRLQLR